MANEPSPYTKYVAQQFRGRVAEGRLRQAEVAESVGLSQSQLSKILRGDRHIDVDMFVKLCWALGLDPVDVLQRASEPAFAALLDTDWHPKALLDEDGTRPDSVPDTFTLAAKEPPYDRRREAEERERSI